MRSRIALFALALVLGVAGLASAQTVADPGVVVRLDPQSSVVMLEDGRMYRVNSSTVFMIDNRPTTFTMLRPGDRVMIHSADPVVYRDGRYVAVMPGPAVVTPPPPPPPVAQLPPPVVVQTPVPAAAVPLGVRQTIYGTITDVDRDGKVKIKTERDSFEARVSPDALRQIKKGDNVVIDLTISPPGAASPR